MPKKLIFTVVVVIILVAELIWGGWTLTKKFPQTQVQPAVSQPEVQSTIILKALKSEFKLGENLPVTIELSTAKSTDGTDVVIIYDPKKLQVVSGASKAPVTVGSLYNEYPSNKIDENTGRIFISGVTSQANGVVGNGVFGSITFKAKVAGPTTISIDFTPNSTVDSNIIETKTAKDVLTGVNNLEINITP